MSSLTPCHACRRHVRVGERACPFCGAARDGETSRAARDPIRWTGVSRAARLALNVTLGASATACGSGAPHTASPAASASGASAPGVSAASASPAPLASASAGVAPEPDAPRRLVAIYGSSAIVIRQSVEFGPQSATTAPSEDNLLQEVARVMLENPQLHLALDGHVDPHEQGDLAALSEARARTVLQRLVKLGVDSARLRARGVRSPAEGRTCSFRVVDEHFDPMP